MNMLLPLTNTCREPSVIDRMTHDIVNQLSVISLCCCELRRSFAEELESDQLLEFKRIETAVQVAANMLQQLKAIIRVDSAGLS
jgi:hypothetical protein